MPRGCDNLEIPELSTYKTKARIGELNLDAPEDPKGIFSKTAKLVRARSAPRRNRRPLARWRREGAAVRAKVATGTNLQRQDESVIPLGFSTSMLPVPRPRGCTRESN